MSTGWIGFLRQGVAQLYLSNKENGIKPHCVLVCAPYGQWHYTKCNNVKLLILVLQSYSLEDRALKYCKVLESCSSLPAQVEDFNFSLLLFEVMALCSDALPDWRYCGLSNSNYLSSRWPVSDRNMHSSSSFSSSSSSAAQRNYLYSKLHSRLHRWRWDIYTTASTAASSQANQARKSMCPYVPNTCVN